MYKSAMDIHTLIDLFIADVCAGKTNETPGAYRSKLKRFAVYVEARTLKLKSISREHVEEFRDQLNSQSVKRLGSKLVNGHLSPFTVHTAMRTLKHFLIWGHIHGYLRDVGNIRITPPPMPDPKPISADNVQALIRSAARTGEAWEQARNTALLYVLRDTGGRLGAILRMDIDKLELNEGKIFTITKGNRQVTLYINAPAISALDAWLAMRPLLNPIDRKVFITPKGTGLTRHGFYSMMARLIDAAGLRGMGRVNAHSFRHAWARDALINGEDLTRVSQTLGHTSVRVTGDYYARWTDGELKTAHKKYSPGAKLPMIKRKPK